MSRIITLKGILIGLIPFFISAGPVKAEDPNNLKSIEDYLAYAALNNAGLKAKFQNWKAALERIPQAKALEDPKFTYSHFIEEVETRVGPQQNKFSLTQTFPWFGKLEAKTEAASAKANLARQQYETAKLELFRDVKNAYYEFSYLATALEIARNNLELLKHFEQVARTKYRTAAATHPDVIRAQIELAKMEDVLNSLQQLKAPTIAQLNAVLNREPNADLTWPDQTTPVELNIDRDEIISKVVRQNPELTELNWRTLAAKAQVEIAKKNFYPDIGVGINWIQTGQASSSQVADSGQDAVAVMFSVNIPLWSDKYKAAERQAKAQVRKYHQQIIDTKNRKIFEAIQILYEIEDNRRKFRLYGNVLVSMAKELIKSSESAYRAGTLDFLSLIDAERMLLKYQLDYNRSVVDYMQTIAKLEVITGIQI